MFLRHTDTQACVVNRSRIFAVFCSVSIVFFTAVTFAFAAGTIRLPATGQQKCYNISGVEISCINTGQDGEYETGVAWPDPRFAVSGECVTDNLTGLMWARNANIPGYKPTWQGAVDYPLYMAALCGYADWRLPNVNELETLVNAGAASSAFWLTKQGFTNVFEYPYWTSTTGAWFSNYKWAVGFLDGTVAWDFHTYPYYMLPVRGDTKLPAKVWKTGQTTQWRVGDDGSLLKGAAWPSPRFTDNGNGTVTDNLTGLSWTKDANTPGPSTCGSLSGKNWQEALDYVKCLNKNAYSGFSDWRLPNRKELFSLIDRSQYSPAIPLNNPFTNMVGGIPYATSTTWAGDTTFAWAVDISNYGVTGPIAKSGNMRVWPVRGGGGLSTLSITKAGTGSGTVTSSPFGISCGNACTAAFSSTTNVVLTATPDGGTTFAGWSGGGCSGAKTCSLTMKSDVTVTATFNISLYTLKANIQGGGSLSSTGLICRGATCKGTYPYNTQVAVTATPNEGESFVSWAGCDGESGNVCAMQMASDKIITATFTANMCTYTISPNKKSFTHRGGKGTVNLTAKGANSCYSPTVTPDEDWITAELVSFKQNRGSVRIAVAGNPTISARAGTVAIGDKVLDVTQTGIPCVLSKLTPPRSSFDRGGGPGEFDVAATDGCEWRAEADAASALWLNITSGSPGTGDGSVTFDVLENNTAKQRTGRINVYLTENPKKKKVFTVTQKK
jgi:hypothetical protein